jgi:hypothetical protein
MNATSTILTPSDQGFKERSELQGRFIRFYRNLAVLKMKHKKAQIKKKTQ